jgi:hypothetical protein
MSTLIDSPDSLGEADVSAELELAVRARGVRVEQRLALLAVLAEKDGEELLEGRIEALEQRLREASRKVTAALRGSGR